jgi:RNA polymerase sigma factor (sigma-70 family)
MRRMAPLLRKGQADRTFERLYRAHVGDIYRYALAVTGNQADAEDVAQTTFMNAYRALERGERPVKPGNWLITIAHNVCRQRYRQSSRRPTEVVFNEDVAEAIVPSDDAPTAADIQRALGHLPLSQREALVMRELEGRSCADIAERLGLSVSAVETLLFRARRALREQLEGNLTCLDAEAAISQQLDGRLPRKEAGALRAHLRECEECRHLARRQRAQRRGWKALAVVPLPASLASRLGHGGVAAGLGSGAFSGAVAKVAAVTVAAVVAGGGGYAIVRHETSRPHHPTLVRAAAGPGKRTSARPAATTAHARLKQRPKEIATGERPRNARTNVTAAPAAQRGAAPVYGAASLPPAAATTRAAPGTASAHHTHPSTPSHTHNPKTTQRPSHPPVHSRSAGQHTPSSRTNVCKPATGTAKGTTAPRPLPSGPTSHAPCPAPKAGSGGKEHPAHP